jgi:spore germination protein YaaH
MVALWCGMAYGVYRTVIMFMPNNELVPAFSQEGQVNVVIEDTVITGMGSPRIKDGRLLLPLPLVKEYLDPYISWDDKLSKLTITTRDRVIRMKTGSLDAYVNNKPVALNIPVIKDGNVFVPIEFLSEFYGIKIEYIEENNVIVIDFIGSEKQYSKPVKKTVAVRTGQSRHAPIVKRIENGGYENAGNEENQLRVFEEYENWYKVRTWDGIIGFVNKKDVRLTDKIPEQTGKEPYEPELWRPESGKINMAWDYAYNVKTNLDKRAKIEGLDVISPTWFQVVGEDGEIKNHADSKYVEWAHNHGYKVWALFSNSFDNAEKTSKFLNNTDARDNAIKQILAFAALYKLDGINIDFENLKASDKGALTQFVREITPLLREQGLVVSIDVNMLPCYDRKALAETVDYVALMAYDQHWKGGGVAGSVSQVSWTERVVEIYLKDVPPEKLLLGIPFYTRLWKETPKDGKIELTSQALSMASIEKFLDENNAPKIWDDESGQFYSEFVKDSSTYKVWLESKESLNLRTSLVHKYGLAGAAAWRLDFELPEVWSVISRNLKAVDSYAQWEAYYSD